MRNLLNLCAVVIFGSLLFSSCEEVELPTKYMEINNRRIELSTATIDDRGTNHEITYRKYGINFESSGAYPTDYLYLNFYSTSTSRLQEGVYEYAFFTGEPGDISDISLGTNLKYDETGNATSGVRFSEFTGEFSGTIKVEKENGDYKFSFDLEAVYNEITYEIKGIYNAPLSEY